ncbi:hypothetical protein [Bosea sp. (in: a-proteobacteria)]|uniref:hypothetical protein n=1 Tax=Bosea sp. (in: a-proteobacteria) TaxID=1871050 RepID=UPI00260F94DB|nr:hypothetical protein [Bosea sp. (in: a-proteobacteria)]MCO5093105.1 hypothetical protein [Bosea sp. (in: a-proteobacteria)]
MIVSRAMAYACLTVLAGLLAFVAVLLILLTVVQIARGEAVPEPAGRAIGTAVAAGLAFLCRAVARRLV